MPLVTTLFVAMAAREPEGRDADYLAWHALDHRPEIHRIPALRGALRLVSTPACRAARAASEDPYDAVDHVMTYLFAEPGGVAELGPLAAGLAEAGRMSRRLPSVEVGTYELDGTATSPRIEVTADVLPWRPVTGVYLLVERGAAPAGALSRGGGRRRRLVGPRRRPPGHVLLPGRRSAGHRRGAAARPGRRAGRTARWSRGWPRPSWSRWTSTGAATCPDRYRIAPRCFSAPISSHDRPSSTSTDSVCSPCSGARVGRPGRSSNCTGTVTMGSASSPPTSTAAM